MHGSCIQLACLMWSFTHTFNSSTVQAVGPVALVSLLLSEGLTKAIPGAEVNANPNRPSDPQVQLQYNHAAIQVGSATRPV